MEYKIKKEIEELKKEIVKWEKLMNEELNECDSEMEEDMVEQIYLERIDDLQDEIDLLLEKENK